MTKSIVSLFAILLFSCSNSDNYKKPDDPLEAGREFIEAALNGNMKKARLFILKDPANERLFDEIEKKYKGFSTAEKAAYKDASIRVNKSQNLNDSTTIINYSNSYKKENNQIKLVKQNNEWWVDFKYTFTGDTTNAVEK
ncbi:MAG: DUF4878 domain-containing protein [Agriterribacter sp.]